MSTTRFLDKITCQRAIKSPHYPWIVLAVVFGTQLSESLAPMGIPVVYPFIQAELGLSRAQVGLITSATAAGGLSTALIAGWLTDRLGVKRTMAIALITLAAVMLCFPLAYSFPLVLALSAGIGVAHCPVYPSTTRAIMEWLPSRIRGSAMGLKQTAVPVGGALAAVILPALAVSIGWRMAVLLMGVFILLIVTVFLALYRDASQGSSITRQANFAHLITLLHNRSLVIAGIWGAIFVGLHFVLLSYFILFLIEEMRFTAIMAGGVLAVAQVSSIFGRPLWGAASDFIFHSRRIPVLTITGLFATLALLGTSLLSTNAPKTAIFLLAIALGISIISWQGVFTTFVGEMVDKRQIGIALGLVNTIMRTAQLAIPPLFGFLADMTGTYALGWKIAALLALLATVMLLVLGKEPQRS